MTYPSLSGYGIPSFAPVSSGLSSLLGANSNTNTNGWFSGNSANPTIDVSGMDWANTGGGSTGMPTFGPNGWLSPAIAGAQTLLGGWLGMKQYGLAKDAFKENKRQFNMNWNANKALTNARLEDRQAARNAADPGAYQSVGDYMAQNSIK